MASRNYTGSRILQSEITKSVRHTGDKVVTGDSSNDSVVARDENTSFRPSEGA